MMTDKLAATRSKVEVNGLFDELMLHELITPPQLQAANRFSEELAASRTLEDADGLVPAMEAGSYDEGLADTLSCMSDCSTVNTACFLSVATGSLSVLPSHVSLEEFAKVVTHNLDCLSSHYGFDKGGQLDPRSILRRQVRLG
jgi:hypothetical protein